MKNSRFIIIKKFLSVILIALSLIFCIDTPNLEAAKKKPVRILRISNAQTVSGGNNNVVVLAQEKQKKKKKKKKATADDTTNDLPFNLAIGTKAKFSWSEDGSDHDGNKKDAPSKKNGLANMTSPIRIASKSDRIFINLGEELANYSRIFTRILDENGQEVAEFDFEDAAEIKLNSSEPQKFYVEYRVRTDSMPKKKKGGLDLGGLSIPIGGISIPLGGSKKDGNEIGGVNDGRTYQYFYILLSVRANADYLIKFHQPEVKSDDNTGIINPDLPPLKNNSLDIFTGLN